MTLPTGWRKATLKSLCQSVPSMDPTLHPERAFGYVDIGAIDNLRGRIRETRRFLGKEAPSRARRPIKPGDVLFSNVRTYLRNIARVPDTLEAELCSTGFTVLRPGGELDGGYLYHYVRSEAFIGAVTPEQTGTHYPATSDRVVLGQSIPLPPTLDEQRRIARQLNRIAARLDDTKARLDTLPATLKRFRMAVLAAACSGRLTADWRDSHGLPTNADECWAGHSLGDMVLEGPQNGLYKPASAYGSGTFILRIDNFNHGSICDWPLLKRLAVSTLESDKFGLANGDIVINRVNSMSHLGKSALVRGLREPCVFESNMMRMRLNEKLIAHEFAILLLSSPHGLAELRRNAKHAVNQSSINQQDVKAVKLNLPLMEEQTEIVRRVEALLKQADAIETRYRQARAFVDKLMPAALAKAFRGELL